MFTPLGSYDADYCSFESVSGNVIINTSASCFPVVTMPIVTDPCQCGDLVLSATINAVGTPFAGASYTAL